MLLNSLVHRGHTDIQTGNYLVHNVHGAEVEKPLLGNWEPESSEVCSLTCLVVGVGLSARTPASDLFT